MRAILTIFILLIPISTIANELKIASWNVENLFDMQYNGTEYDEYIPYHHGWIEKRFKQKLSHLSEVICDLDADVIALQEVENENALRKLQKTLEKNGCPYRYSAITTKPKTPIHNALLSRVKISSKRDILIKPYGKYRAILKVTLDTTPPLILFVNHWKSQRDKNESKRIDYAKALVRAIKKLDRDSEYILLGDFNSDFNEYLRVKNHISGINQILRSTISNHTLRCEDLKSCKGLCHCNLWSEVSASNRWSHNFYGKKEAIDAILIPPTLLDGKDWEYKRGSFAVFSPRYLIEKHNIIKRWEYNRNRHIGKGYSDHLAIYATFYKINSIISTIKSIFSTKEKDINTTKSYQHFKTVASLLDSFKKGKLKYPVILDSAKVVFKRGKVAVIQCSRDDRGIIIYGKNYGLEEAKEYQIKIFEMKYYKTTPEITDIEIVKDRGEIDTKDYIREFSKELFQSKKYLYSIVRYVEGVYNNRYLYTKDIKIPIYFKKRVKRPDNKTYIKIIRGQIGYYNGKFELIIYSSKDYKKE